MGFAHPPPILPEVQNFREDEWLPRYGNGHPCYGNGHPRYGNGHSRYGNGRPRYGNGHPCYGNGRPHYGNGHPHYGNGRPRYGSGRPVGMRAVRLGMRALWGERPFPQQSTDRRERGTAILPSWCGQTRRSSARRASLRAEKRPQRQMQDLAGTRGVTLNVPKRTLLHALYR